MSLFTSDLFQSQEPGKCCYWEDGTKVGDADPTPCEPFLIRKRENSDYWVENISLGQPIYPGILLNRKNLCYALHIFKHVESVGLECNNELQLNDYLKKLINKIDNKNELKKLKKLKPGSDVGLCLKDNNNNILLKVKDIGYDYLIYHLSKKTDDTCSVGDWENGLDNYGSPELDSNKNPMQYSLFKTGKMEDDRNKAIEEWNNSPSLPVVSPVSVALSSPMSEKQNLPEGSPKTPRSLKKALEVVENTANSLQRKRIGKEKLDPVKFQEKIEKIKKKEDENNIKKERWEERLINFNKISPPTALNPTSSIFTPTKLSPDALEWTPPPKGGTKKRIKKRKTKKRKTKAKKTKRKH